MAIAHETLVSERYWCVDQQDLCFLISFSFSPYSSLSFYDFISEYIYIYYSLRTFSGMALPERQNKAGDQHHTAVQLYQVSIRYTRRSSLCLYIFYSTNKHEQNNGKTNTNHKHHAKRSFFPAKVRRPILPVTDNHKSALDPDYLICISTYLFSFQRIFYLHFYVYIFFSMHLFYFRCTYFIFDAFLFAFRRIYFLFYAFILFSTHLFSLRIFICISTYIYSFDAFIFFSTYIFSFRCIIICILLVALIGHRGTVQHIIKQKEKDFNIQYSTILL